MADLTTVAHVKDAAGIRADGTADDALLARLVSAASAVAERYCHRSFTSASYTELRDGTGTDILLCRQAPLTAIASVTVDGVALSARTAVGGAGYFIADAQVGVIALAGALFTRGRGNVQIAYTAGYASTPADIEQAVIDWVARKYAQKKRHGLRSEGIGEQTTSYDIGAMPADVRLTLDAHRRVAPC